MDFWFLGVLQSTDTVLMLGSATFFFALVEAKPLFKKHDSTATETETAREAKTSQALTILITPVEVSEFE